MATDLPNQYPPSRTPAASDVPWERVESFVGQFSHDLRNGLNACELQLTFLAEISTDPDAVEEIKGLRASLNSITKQLQTVRTAVGSSKAHTLNYPAVDLFEDLRERFQRLHPEAAKRIEWKIKIEASKLVSIDPEITLSAALELLNNATVFADAGTPIVCEMQGHDDHVLCSVTEVCGMEPAVAAQEWGCSPLRSTRRGAYGLGLFRVRRSLQAQGSSLTFQHSVADKSLTAMMTLPLTADSRV